LPRWNGLGVEADGVFQAPGRLDEAILPLAEHADAVQGDGIAGRVWRAAVGIGRDDFGPILTGS